MNKQKIAFWIFTVIGSGVIAFAFIMGMISQIEFDNGISATWIIWGLVIVIGIAIVLYWRSYKVKGFEEKTKYYLCFPLIIFSGILLTSPIMAYAAITPTQHACIKNAIITQISVITFIHQMNPLISRQDNTTADAKIINATIGQVENCLK